MSVQEHKETSEQSVGVHADGAGSASAAGGLGASASSKKSEERRKPEKLGPRSPTTGAQDLEGKTSEESPSSSEGQQQRGESQLPKGPQSRRTSQSRGRRGRGQSMPPSDTDSTYRSDVSQRPKRNRNRNRGEKGSEPQPEQERGPNGLGKPLEALDEVGDTVNGVTDTVDGVTSGAGDLVQNTAGNAVGKTHEAIGGLLSNKKGGKKGKQEGEVQEEKKGGPDEQLRLRLDLNLDIEVQLKAKIHGDLTLGLLN